MASPSFRTRYGKTCSLRRSSFLQSPHAPTILVLLGPPGSPTRPSSKLRPSPIIFSCGSTHCFRFFLHRWKPLSFSSSLLWQFLALFFCPFFREKEKKAGSAVQLR